MCFMREVYATDWKGSILFEFELMTWIQTELVMELKY